jgi:hypothetical protein
MLHLLYVLLPPDRARLWLAELAVKCFTLISPLPHKRPAGTPLATLEAVMQPTKVVARPDLLGSYWYSTRLTLSGTQH